VGSCSDGNACTTFDRCVDGECRGSDVLDCDDKNVCTTDTCNATTGCVHTNNTNSCNDRDACTQTDACVNGVCVGGNPVTCGPPDQCHEAGVCVPATGACAYPNKTDGTACDDGSLCTRGETCQSGACTAAINGLDNPAPKSSGYYKTLCEKRAHNQLPFQGDQLTDADATCVGTLISTFAGISTIDGICDVLGKSRHGGRHHGGHGSGPNGRECDKGEDELMATAINVCRARVCEDQDLDSHCPGNAHSTVLQALAAADAILDDAARTRESCGIATCELREINDGHALELNSLSLALEIDRVRLTWSSFSSDDGSGTPDSYEVWRRAMGSNDAFVRIGSTQETTFLDAAAGTAAWEYDVTAVFPEDSY
jgi:hypothetical protein